MIKGTVRRSHVAAEMIITLRLNERIKPYPRMPSKGFTGQRRIRGRSSIPGRKSPRKASVETSFAARHARLAKCPRWDHADFLARADNAANEQSFRLTHLNADNPDNAENKASL